MKNIIENNKIIAEFLNLTSQVIFEQVWAVSENGKTNFYKKDELKFHSDWNWLMPVIEKIESLGYKIDISKWENSQYCGIYLNGKKIAGNETSTKIEAVYNACIEFIKWYITQNK